jgi:hypothetical protein
LRGALLQGADATGLDVDSARIDTASVPNLAKATHLDRAARE